jgi:hypothetical protein
MSANGATNQRLGFHRWLASLKREAPSAPGVTNAPVSAAPPVASLVPPAPHEVATPPAPRAQHDDATRVHHVPKEIIHRMRARAASQAPNAPQDERTQVFRAPPELLERAKRAQEASLASSEVQVPPSDELLLEHEFGDTLEARSGVSLRQEHLPTTQPLDEPTGAEEPHEAEALSAEDALDDETVAAYVDAPLQTLLGPALVNDAPVDQPSSASIERPSEAPSFRPSHGGKLWLAALMVIAAVLFAWSTR